jgi:FtsH-binding integral membrane protein
MKKLFLLFWEVFRISLLVIGGGYALVSVADAVFAKRGWTREGELVDNLPTYQMIPGILAGHNAVYVGSKVAGALGAFVALTAAVFVTRKDFSFLRSFLVFASFAALGLILASLIFGFTLGIVFTGAMIALACGYILYDTSNVMLHCDETMDVVASIELFASLMTLFYYILHLLLSLNRD